MNKVDNDGLCCFILSGLVAVISIKEILVNRKGNSIVYMMWKIMKQENQQKKYSNIFE